MNNKKSAGEKAIEFIKDGMTIGLGTGSTVQYTIYKVAELLKEGMKLKCVSTSSATSKLAQSLNITVTPFNSVKNIDLTIDGADEVDPALNGIKGGGGALLFEKLVARASLKNIWVVDSSKIVTQLGKFPLPVEVVRFGAEKIFTFFETNGYNPRFRMNGIEHYITDSNNTIIDLDLGMINDAPALEKSLKEITGVVECGLFVNIADMVIVGNDDGTNLISRNPV